MFASLPDGLTERFDRQAHAAALDPAQVLRRHPEPLREHLLGELGVFAQLGGPSPDELMMRQGGRGSRASAGRGVADPSYVSSYR